MNPSLLFKLGSAGKAFAGRHPRFIAFLSSLKASGVPEGMIVDVKVTYPDGRTAESNIKVTPEDAASASELLQML